MGFKAIVNRTFFGIFVRTRPERKIDVQMNSMDVFSSLCKIVAGHMSNPMLSTLSAMDRSKAQVS